MMDRFEDEAIYEQHKAWEAEQEYLASESAMAETEAQIAEEGARMRTEEQTYTLTCEKCKQAFSSTKAFPNPQFCPDCEQGQQVREAIAKELYYMTYPGGGWDRVEEDVRVHWRFKADKILSTLHELGYRQIPELTVLTDIDGKDIKKAITDLESHKLSSLFSYRQAYFVGAQAQRDKDLKQLEGVK